MKKRILVVEDFNTSRQIIRKRWKVWDISLRKQLTAGKLRFFDGKG